MRLSSLLLLLTTAYLGVNGFPGSGLSVRQNSDAEVIAKYATEGACFSYIDISPCRNPDKSLQPCETWCNQTGQDTSSVTCFPLADDQFWQKDPSIINKDEQGCEWVVGNCTCGGTVGALAGDIADIVVQGLSELTELICVVFVTAFVDIAEIGLDFVPGAEELGAIGEAVQGAKSFVENGLDAASFFGNWINKACGASNFSTIDPLAVFNPLTLMPDAWGTSIGCKRKSGCKPLPKPEAGPPAKPPPAPKPKPTVPKPEPTAPKPNPTEPKPTEPKPTEPKPTESKPTESQPTESQPTESKPTGSKPTTTSTDLKTTNTKTETTTTTSRAACSLKTKTTRRRQEAEIRTAGNTGQR